VKYPQFAGGTTLIRSKVLNTSAWLQRKELEKLKHYVKEQDIMC
jgi:hypothetical protein